MVKGIEHIGVMARDTAALAEWYERVLGMRTVFRNDASPATFFLAAGEGPVGRGSLIEIFPFREGPEYPATPGRQILHIAFAIEDWDAAVERLRSHGVSLIGEPVDVFNGGRLAFFNDPEGNWLQLMYRPVAPWPTV